MNDVGRTRAERVRTWVQTIGTIIQSIGIIIAAIWAYYTFVYKEFTAPMSAPVNVSIDLTLRKTGLNDTDNKNLSAIEVAVSAHNPSSRTVNLLPSVYSIYGLKVGVRHASESDLSEEASSTASKLNQESLADIGRHWNEQEVALVAMGNLYLNKVLRPNEKIKRTLVIYVPTNMYDKVEGTVYIPIVRDPTRVEAEYIFDEENSVVLLALDSIDAEGKPEPVSVDEYAGYLGGVGFEYARASTEMSLW